MRILLYGLNYAPELTGIGKYSGELGAWLHSRGHEVRVITAPPYYPAWRIADAYRDTLFRLEHAPGEPTIYRVPLWVPAQPSGAKRVLHLLSFALGSLPVLAIQPLWQPDVVINIEPAFFSAPFAWLLARFCGARCWLHVQDFEIDAAFELGLLPSGGVIQSLASAFEQGFTRRFDRVSSISRPMVARLATKRVLPERRVLFPNWVELDNEPQDSAISGDPVREVHSGSYRDELGLHGKIVVLYSGNMGAKQGLDLFAPLAQSLLDNDSIAFVFCGDGAFRPELEKQVSGLSNVRLLPLQPAARLATLLRSADIHLLPQRAGAADLVMPSKLAGMLGSGRPVLATAEPDTEIARTVEGHGLIVPPGDLPALRAGLLALANNQELRERFGHAARLYAEENLAKEHVLPRFEADLISLVQQSA